MFTKLIAMQNNLGLGHKGDFLLTTQERVDANQEPIAKDIVDEEHAKELVRRWNAFEKEGIVDKLAEALETALPFIVAHDVTVGVISGAALQLQDAITSAKS